METGCLGNPYFTYWLPKRPVFLFILTLTQSVRLPKVTYPSLCSPCVTYGTLCHAIGHQVLPHPLDDFPGCLTGHNAMPEVTHTHT